MIDINSWMNDFLTALDKAFGNRVRFVGLQGSYAREEATETSDIDTVVILDELTAKDINAYSTMLDTLPHRELCCGFISGEDEISSWEASDLFQFYYDTKPIRGTLDFLLTRIDDDAIKRAIKIGACNIYHGCVHNMLYEKSDDILRGLYKSASFVVQAIHFQETGRYITHQNELLQLIDPDEKVIIDTFVRLKSDVEIDFEGMSKNLYEWSKKWINIT